MPKASRTPPIKEALEGMEKAEDEEQKFLRRAAILLAAMHLSTRSNTMLRATYNSLTESLDHYMGQSHELRHVIKEVGWDDESWPELHDEHLKEAREKLGHEVEEALINLNEKADMQDRWNDFDGNSPAANIRSQTEDWINDLATTPSRSPPTLQEIPDAPFSQQGG